MLEVRETPGSTFGVFDTEKNDYYRSPDGVTLTRDTLAGANQLLQSLQRDVAKPEVRRSRFHTYKNMKRDFAIIVGLIVLLVIVNSMG